MQTPSKSITVSRLLLSCLAVIGLNNQALATSYSIAAIDSADGANVYSRYINNAGQVAGATYGSSYNFQAFIYSNGSMTHLGTLGGTYSEATGISNNGQVVGVSTTVADPGIYHGFIFSNGSMTDLGRVGLASDINNYGQVVGQTYGSHNPFLYSNGSMLNLGTLGGVGGDAVSINDNGQVAGSAAIAAGNAAHAFVYNNGSMTDLGTLGGTSSYAAEINNNGQVVGRANTASGASHAFLYTGASMIDMGTLGGATSYANGINVHGQVVGNADLAPDALGYSLSAPFIYTGGSMVNLNNLLAENSGWTLNTAYGINDAGQIVGAGTFNGQSHAFIMTAAVPVPATMWLFGSGLIGLVGLARKCKAVS